MHATAGLPPVVSLAEVRTGKAARLGMTDITSAIAKSVRAGKVMIGPTGVEGDEQAAKIIHGGPEKAVLHFAADHYAAWARQLPEQAAFFQPGGFGENLVSYGLDETTVCIGDIVAVGSVLLQVSQPRQPCFKLNHRFHHPHMSMLVQDHGHAGWYYRVLQSGEVQAGDLIAVVERPHPGWPVWQVSHHLYTATLDGHALEQLAMLEALAPTMRTVFAKRLATGMVEPWSSRLHGQQADAIAAPSPAQPPG